MIAVFGSWNNQYKICLLFGSFIINDDLYFFPFFLVGGWHIFEKEEEGRKKRGIIYKGKGYDQLGNYASWMWWTWLLITHSSLVELINRYQYSVTQGSFYFSELKACKTCCSYYICDVRGGCRLFSTSVYQFWTH